MAGFSSDAAAAPPAKSGLLRTANISPQPQAAMEPWVLRDPASDAARRRVHRRHPGCDRDGVETLGSDWSAHHTSLLAGGLCRLLRRGSGRGGARQVDCDRPLPALRTAPLERVLVAPGIRQRAVRVFCHAARARSAARHTAAALVSAAARRSYWTPRIRPLDRLPGVRPRGN